MKPGQRIADLELGAYNLEVEISGLRDDLREAEAHAEEIARINDALLEACELLVEYYADAIGSEGEQPESNCECSGCDVLTKARAAISAAKGE